MVYNIGNFGPAGRAAFKAFAFGVTFIIQTAFPAIAGASDSPRPELFGDLEIRSDDISAFSRWMAMLDRFEAPLHSAAPVSSGVTAWREEIERLKGLPPREQIKGVNDFLNKVTYVDDRSRYGESGYWDASPERFFSDGGDCKDYSIAKYASLRALNFLPEQLRIAVVIDKTKHRPHAVLIVNESTDIYVLDNQNQNIDSIAQVHRYQPIFWINSRSWWRDAKSMESGGMGLRE